MKAIEPQCVAPPINSNRSKIDAKKAEQIAALTGRRFV
jgi:hypothetical protein